MGAYSEGCDAFAKGLDVSENPYPVGSADHKAWSEGWKDEKEQYEAGM